MVIYMATDSPALDFAFGPRPQRQIDPIIAIMAQNFANQAGQRRQAENALALQAQSERAADERQAAALAAQERLQSSSAKDTAERQLALENERALNDQVAAEALANKVRTKKYEEAAEYGFEVDPKQPAEVNEARADSVLQKADREAYKQVIAESEKISKVRDEKLKEFQKGSAADPKTVSAYFLKSLAENPLLPKTVSSLLGRPEYMAAIKSGRADDVVAALKSRIAPADMLVLEGELAKAYTTAEAIAAEEWKDKSKVIIAEYERADSRQRELSDELKKMTSGWPARRFRERKEELGGDQIPEKVQSRLGLEPRAETPSQPATGPTYPDDRSVEEPVSAIPSPATSPFPASTQPQPPAVALDGIGAPYANMIYGDPRKAQQSQDYATLNRLTKFPGYESALPVFRDPALGGYSLGNIGLERGFSPEGLSNLVATAGAANVRPGTGLKNAKTGAIMTQQQLMAAREIAKRLLGIVDQPERPSYTLDISNPDVFEPATIPNELAISPMR